MNICGCLIHVAPRHKSEATKLIADTDGCEVHAQSEDGRYVVVVEDTADKLASATIMDLHQIPGVVSLTLTYHHFEHLPPTADDAGIHTGETVDDHI